MALISCPECNTQVSDRAETCVSCGIPIYDKSQDYNLFKMKKEGWKSILKLFGTISVLTLIGLVVISANYYASKETIIAIMAITFKIGAFPLFHYRKIDTKEFKQVTWGAYIGLVIVSEIIGSYILS